MWQSKVEPAPNVKLTAYNGGEIECCGVLKILCRYKDCQWRKYKFYVVDVDGPAILGFRACEQMHVVTINAIKSSANCTSVPAGTAQKTTVTSIDDLKKQFPDQFDRIGSFEGKASLFLKTRCETIDRRTTQVQHPPQGETATGTRQYGERRHHTKD